MVSCSPPSLMCHFGPGEENKTSLHLVPRRHTLDANVTLVRYHCGCSPCAATACRCSRGRLQHVHSSSASPSLHGGSSTSATDRMASGFSPAAPSSARHLVGIPPRPSYHRAASDANIRNFAPVARIMKTALPDNAKIAKEAKECMQECVSEFISFITSEGKCAVHQHG